MTKQLNLNNKVRAINDEKGRFVYSMKRISDIMTR